MLGAGFATCLSGCLSESSFVTDFTEVYCDRFFECADEAQLVFDGIDSAEDCRAVVGPQTADLAAQCKLRGRDARDCMAQLEALECPAEGGVFEDAVPASCNNAWHTCAEQGGVEDP